jgi:hypothetical protein
MFFLHSSSFLPDILNQKMLCIMAAMAVASQRAGGDLGHNQAKIDCLQNMRVGYLITDFSSTLYRFEVWWAFRRTICRIARFLFGG